MIQIIILIASVSTFFYTAKNQGRSSFLWAAQL